MIISRLIKNIIMHIYMLEFEKPKPVKMKKCCQKCVEISKENCILHISTNIVYEVTLNGKKYFFRECEKHFTKRKYVKNFINLFFDIFVKDRVVAKKYKRLIIKSLNVRKNFHKFTNMEETIQLAGGHSPYYDFFLNLRDLRFVGIDNNMDILTSKRLNDFLRFSISKLSNYSLNDFGIFSNRWNVWKSNRIFAYNAILDLLKLNGEYTPAVSYCRMKILGYELFGTLMEKASGIPAAEFSNRNIKNFLPDIQKKLMNLSVVDYLCIIRDHTTWNYNVLLNENDAAVSVCCFDNDEPDSFSTVEIYSFNGNHGESALVDDFCMINRPYFDVEMADCILKLTKKEVYSALNQFVSKKQIFRLWQRVVFLKSALENTTRVRPHFLLTPDEWSYDTVAEECTGKYGKTYLCSLLN